MKKNFLMSLVAVLALLAIAIPAFALEAFMVRESEGTAPAGAPYPCPATANSNGNCANYRWYNACAGYIWIFNNWVAGEGVGVRFGGALQPCVSPGHRVKRAIHYFRNILVNYNQTVDIYLDEDCNNDGCPEGNLGSALNVDPGLRWNCINYGVCLQCNGVIARQVHDGGAAPTFATDGPFKYICDPGHKPTNSFYYGVNGNTCVPWLGVVATDPDDFFIRLIVDTDPSCPTATENTSWGKVKGLYQ